MKKALFFWIGLAFASSYAQEHFSGMTTSRRVGITNVGINPSEIVNLNNRFEIQFISSSFNISNNIVGFKDITGDKNIESLVFDGTTPVNLNIDSEIMGPGFAMRALGWGFAITTKSYLKADINDFDPQFGKALFNNDINLVTLASLINNEANQRISATVWGEIGLSAAKSIINTKSHQLNVGATLKLLFPGTYANFGAGNFKGTITDTTINGLSLSELSNASAYLNLAYSGSLGSNFTNPSDFTKSFFGNLKGVASDFGFDYQYKGDSNNYKFKIGAAIKNIGSLTFKDENNSSKYFALDIHGTDKLNLTQFEEVTSFEEIETIIANSTGTNGKYFTLEESNKDFVIKLPTVINAYANIKVFSKFDVSLFMQQKVNDDSGNDQIVSQNSFSITPRLNLGFFELFAPISKNEISGNSTGIGFRLGGFFLGSNAAITALTADGKQADFYTGFRIGFL